MRITPELPARTTAPKVQGSPNFISDPEELPAEPRLIPIPEELVEEAVARRPFLSVYTVENDRRYTDDRLPHAVAWLRS
jgi:hypothetical protein